MIPCNRLLRWVAISIPLLCAAIVLPSCGDDEPDYAKVGGNWAGRYTLNYSCVEIGQGTDAGTFDLHITQSGPKVAGDFTVASGKFGEQSGRLSGSVSSTRLYATLFVNDFVMSIEMRLYGGTFSGAYIVQPVTPSCELNGTASARRA